MGGFHCLQHRKLPANDFHSLSVIQATTRPNHSVFTIALIIEHNQKLSIDLYFEKTE